LGIFAPHEIESVMNTDTLSDAVEQQPSAGTSWLAISRARAFWTHLAVSSTIVGTACAVIFFVWYPYPYFHAAGAWNVLRVLIGVDLVLGPLLTLIVFKPGKRWLKIDLSIIALVQIAALLYGLTVIYRERPYFMVFAVDRFFLIAAPDVDAAQLAEARSAGRIDDKPLRGPLFIVADRPTDAAGLNRLVDETVFGGQPDIERRPEYWRRFADEGAQVVGRSRPLAALRAARPDAAIEIAALAAKLGRSEDQIRFLPLVAKSRDVSLIVDAATGAPIDVVDTDPWIASAPPTR
jgi:hypothetical protein